MAVFKCKMCAATLNITEGATVCECEFCGTKQTLPKLADDKRANLYDRAGHFRRANEYDKAMAIYEQILSEDTTDSESYWSLVLCRYGIEYVEDPMTHKRIPTVNRAQYTSIYDDEDYKSAILHAYPLQKEIYEREAEAINEIQKGILEISNREEPFDVFICYKETDIAGRRTKDSVLAQELYFGLKNEGFKVFFARITLEDKLGSAYEPYIFAALNSSKVMVVLGTSNDNFNAVWVKNEWSRYLSLIKKGEKKVLIPAYKDMDPYNLPEEFSHLQAQDMSKLGFMQDLIRGIKKIAKPERTKTELNKTVLADAVGANTAPLLRRAAIFLEDGDFDSADEYAEKCLDINPECAEAYIIKVLGYYNLHSESELVDCPFDFSDNPDYKKAVRFGDEELKARLEKIIKERKYNEAKLLLPYIDNSTNYANAEKLLTMASGFSDADELLLDLPRRRDEIFASIARKIMHPEKWSGKIFSAKNYIESINNTDLKNTLYLELEEQKKAFSYYNGNIKLSSKEFAAAIKIFENLGDYRDSKEKVAEAKRRLDEFLSEHRRKVKNEEKKKKIKLGIIIAAILAFVAFIVVVIVIGSIFSASDVELRGGVELELDEVNDCYILTGIDEDWKGTDIVIPMKYRGLSVCGIDDYAFYGCSELTSIVIPDSVISIGDSAFRKCTSLERVSVGKELENIGDYAFLGCEKITSITLPSSVEYIGGYVFSECERLSVIVYTGTTVQWHRISKDVRWSVGGSFLCIDCTNMRIDCND